MTSGFLLNFISSNINSPILKPQHR